MITESQVLDAMRHIIDPDFGKDIVSLGFIKDIKIEDGSVSFSVELTTPACPVKEQFQKLGAEPAPGTSKQLEAFVASETKRWSRVVTDNKLKVE